MTLSTRSLQTTSIFQFHRRFQSSWQDRYKVSRKFRNKNTKSQGKWKLLWYVLDVTVLHVMKFTSFICISSADARNSVPHLQIYVYIDCSWEMRGTYYELYISSARTARYEWLAFKFSKQLTHEYISFHTSTRF